MKKKILSLLLITTMSLSIVGCSEKAKPNNNDASKQTVNDTNGTSDTNDENETKDTELDNDYLLSLPETTAEDFIYKELDDGTIWIKKYRPRNYDKNAIVVVPTKIDGKIVSAIGAEAFWNKELKAVVVKGDVKKIGGDAFTSAKIDKLLITAPLKELTKSVFMLAKIKEIVLPETLEIVNAASIVSAKIETLIIPKNVKIIESGAFSLSKIDKIIIEGDCESQGAFLGSDKIGKVIFKTGNVVLNNEDGDFLTTSGALNGTNEKTNTILVAPKGSKVEEYANKYGLNFEVLE